MLKKGNFGMMFLFVGFFLSFGLIGCNLNDLNMDNENSLEGTWLRTYPDNEYKYVFNGSNFTLLKKNGSTYINRQKGTFSINNGRITINTTHDWENSIWVAYTYNGIIADITISGNQLTLSKNGPGWPTNWSVTYTTYVKE